MLYNMLSPTTITNKQATVQFSSRMIRTNCLKAPPYTQIGLVDKNSTPSSRVCTIRTGMAGNHHLFISQLRLQRQFSNQHDFSPLSLTLHDRPYKTYGQWTRPTEGQLAINNASTLQDVLKYTNKAAPKNHHKTRSITYRFPYPTYESYITFAVKPF